MSVVVPQNHAEPPGPKLYSDLLLPIFTFIADMYLESEEQTPAVDTLRRISQVCSTWRDIILESPSLWGRVLNLTRLRGLKDWRDEVVRRTKGSWLYIKATPDVGDYDDPHRFGPLQRAQRDNSVRLFIMEHWERIWRLDVKTPLGHCPEVDELDQWCSLFSRPTNIRHLMLKSSIPTSEIFPPLSPALFPHLEVLELSDHPNALTGSSGTPPNSLLFQPPVTLPTLKQIKIHSHWPPSIDDVFRILQKIVPGNGCTFHFCSVSPENFHSTDFFPDVLAKYWQYARATFSSVSGIRADVTITSDIVRFLVSTLAQEYFRFFLKSDEGDSSVQTISNFITCFESFQCDEVKRLSLVLHPPSTLPELAKTAIQKITRAFPYVEDLEVDGHTLRHLDSFQQNANFVVFPTLKSITIRECEAICIQSFLESRTSSGGTVETLVLTVLPDIIAVLEILQKYKGIKLLLSDPEGRGRLAVHVD